MKELEEFKKQIAPYKRLKLSVSKALYQKALDTQDKALKKEYMDELIMGTLYVVYEYLKSTGFDMFSNAYDMNDIINGCVEAWIKKINNGSLLKALSYARMFDRTFFNTLYESICGISSIKYVCDDLSLEDFSDNFAKYIECKNENKNIKDKRIFDRIYDKLAIEDGQKIKLSNTCIDNIARMLINIDSWESISNDTMVENNMEDEIVDRVFYEEFVKDLDNAIKNDRNRDIIHKRYGIDGDTDYSQNELADYYGFTQANVHQIETHTFRKLRKEKSITHYADALRK